MIMRRLVLTLVTALALLWPALVNNGPFWHPDSSTYIRSADAAAVVITGVPTEWSDRLRVGESGPLATKAGDGLEKELEKLEPTRPVLTGRSIYYGFSIYTPRRILGPGAAIALQAMLVASLLIFCGHIALRIGVVRRPSRLLFALALIVVLSPLPFYVTMLMPDVYSGVMILMLAFAFCYWPRLATTEKIVLVLASSIFAAFHTTHLLIAIIMAMIGTALGVIRRPSLRPPLLCAPVVAVAVLASAAFNYAVVKSLGSKPISPPFLSARLTAAGPGAAYLQRACHPNEDAWALCRYRERLPAESDEFLWRKDSVFQAATGAEQRRMASEDKQFAAAVLAFDPLGVAAVTLSSSLSQLVSFNLNNFNYSVDHSSNLRSKYPPNVADQIARTRAAHGTMPTMWTLTATIAVTALSLIALVYWGLQTLGSRHRRASTEAQFVMLVVLSVLANAAVCGGLSGPHARYQMRLVWLLPVVAVAFVRPSRRSRSDIEHTRTAEALQ